jgi:vacuolar-type H+-ATPase subunit F/Vma7
MRAAPIYVGDEVTAAGFRLAGVRAIVPDRGAEHEAFSLARAEGSLVMICASVAARIEADELRTAVIAAEPPCVVLRDLNGDFARPDVAQRLRSQLGLEA